MSDAYAQMLTEKRANIWEQAKALLDGAANEKRELTAEEQASYDKMTTDLGDLRSTIDKLTEDRKAARDSEEALRALAEQPTDPAFAPKPVDMNKELRAFFKGERRAIDVNGTIEDNRWVEAYRTRNLPGSEFRALGPGSAGAGGATIPISFYDKLWAHLINASQFLQSGITVLRTDGGEQLNLSSTTAHSTASWTAAGAPITESDPTFSPSSLKAYKGAVLLTVDQELVDDTGVDLEGYLSMQAGRAVGNLIGQGLVVGTGSTQPTGITTQTTLGVTGGTGVGGKMTFDDVINLFYSVIPQYRASQSAAFVTADASIGYLRTLKDNYGHYLWEPSLVAGTPDTILTKPVIQEVWMPAIATSAKSMLFGDLSAYFARIAGGLRFEMSRDYAFANDQITYRCILRADGTLLDQTGAVKHFVGAAT